MTVETIKDWLKQNTKKWGFQCEVGKDGYHHYQGRVSLNEKVKDVRGFIDKKAHWSPTSKPNKLNSNFYKYVTKEDTRLEGPWTDKDVDLFVPDHIKQTSTLLPWQQFIVDSGKVFERRRVNYIIQPQGNVGKSILVGWIRAYHPEYRVLPPVNDCKDLLRMVDNQPKGKMYVFDMPKSMKQDKLSGFYAGVETLKDGYSYDDRHKFHETVFNPPVIWIFSNTEPNLNALSRDRWNFYNIVEGELAKVEIST